MGDDVTQQTQAFVELLTFHQPDLFAYIRSLALDGDLADEVLQETNALLWEKRLEFRPGSHFLAWAFQVARFKLMSTASRRRRGIAFSEQLLEQLADRARQRAGEDLRQARLGALRACLRQLPEKDRSLIELRYAGNSGEQAASALRRPVRSVYKAATRIRRALLQCVQRRLHAEGWR